MLQMSGMIMNRVPDVTERRVKPILPAAAEVRCYLLLFFKLSLVLNMTVFLIYSYRSYFGGTISYPKMLHVESKDLDSVQQPLYHLSINTSNAHSNMMSSERSGSSDLYFLMKHIPQTFNCK